MKPEVILLCLSLSLQTTIASAFAQADTAAPGTNEQQLVANADATADPAPVAGPNEVLQVRSLDAIRRRNAHLKPTVQKAPAAKINPNTTSPLPRPLALPPTTPTTPTPPGGKLQEPAPPEANGPMPSRALMADGHPKLALTLAGGGARGAAHVGVLKVLEANGIKPDYITGASAGAMIGALYCAGVPVNVLERMVLNGEFQHAFMPHNLHWQTAKAGLSYGIKRMCFMHPKIGLYSGKSIEELMNRYLPPDQRCIEKLHIPFTAVATNLIDTRTVWLTKGDVAEAVHASCCVPVVYKPMTYGDKLLVDGGIRSNLPTAPAAAANAPIVVAVRLYGTLAAEEPQEYNTIYAYGDRLLDALLAQIETCAVAHADVIVNPDVGELKVYSFDQPSLIKAERAGEEAAYKALPEIRRLLQGEHKMAEAQGEQHE